LHCSSISGVIFFFFFVGFLAPSSLVSLINRLMESTSDWPKSFELETWSSKNCLVVFSLAPPLETFFISITSGNGYCELRGSDACIQIDFLCVCVCVVVVVVVVVVVGVGVMSK
jgi:hypothetical protein